MSISGKFLFVQVGNVILAGSQKWTVRDRADKLDGTTGADQGFENDQAGVRRLEITINFVQDTETGIWSVIQSGTILNNLKLFRDQTDPNPAFLIPIATCYEAENDIEVTGRSTIRSQITSNGPYIANDPGH